jgi:hypothetical protein
MMAPEPADIEVKLVDPSGNDFEPGDTGFSTIATTDRQFLEMRAAGSPALDPGLWKVHITGTGAYRLDVKANTDLHMAYLGPSWSLAQGRLTHLRAGLLSSDPEWRLREVQFRLTSFTGNTTIPLALHDDGQHGDGAAGDGLFGGGYIPTIPGIWYLEAFGRGEDGRFFRRMDPAFIRVSRSRIAEPPPRTAAPDSSQNITFTIHNDNVAPGEPNGPALAANTTYELALFSSRGWAVTGTVPASVTIPYGGSTDIQVAVHVPRVVPHGAVEETTLVAIEAGQIGASLEATGRITAKSDHVIFLPQISR